MNVTIKIEANCETCGAHFTRNIAVNPNNVTPLALLISDAIQCAVHYAPAQLEIAEAD